MEVLSKDEIRLLLNIGYAACAKGQVLYSRRIFDNLLAVFPDMEAVKIGKAFSHIVVDEFDKSQAILEPLTTSENVGDEVYALLAFSYALQKREQEAKDFAGKVSSENESAYALAQSALALI